jgi:hypothetical protein
VHSQDPHCAAGGHQDSPKQFNNFSLAQAFPANSLAGRSDIIPKKPLQNQRDIKFLDRPAGLFTTFISNISA